MQSKNSALKDLEYHFKNDEWPLVLDSVADGGELALEVAAQFIYDHPRAQIFWAPVSIFPNGPSYMFISKWSIKKTLEYFRAEQVSLRRRFASRQRGLRLDNIKLRA